MKTLTKTEAADFLLAQDHYVILTHTRPDGDTVGSSAALCLGLRKLGKTAHVLENAGISPKYKWLHEGLSVSSVSAGDCLVSVDVASPGMLQDEAKDLADRVKLRIDHHGSATSFTEFETVEPESASCAEIIYDLLMLMHCEQDEKIATAIYVGVSTDTGCFRYANTTAHTFAVAAACAGTGAKIYELNMELFETNTLARLKMQGWIVDHMKLLRNGTMCICAIARSVEQEMGVTADDMDNISSFPRTVAGVRIAATLREGDNGQVKLSVRAVPGYDATLLTVPFGGGGHKGAAGATINMTLAEAAEAVERVMLSLEERHP